MRLTKQSDYAIRTLVYCALKADNLSRVTDIAKAYEISELFLFKIIKPLVDGGLVKTIRGRRGGITLAQPATDITVAQTLRLTEESFALAECFNGEVCDCPLVDNCTYRAALDLALENFFEALEHVTIAQLVENSGPLRSLLMLDEAAAH